MTELSRDTQATVAAKKKKGRAACVIAVISVLLLVNVNIGIIDILPDTIAYFLLARLLTYASDRAPFFAEAREGLMKLGWLNLLKLPGLFIIAGARMNNAFGNDTSVIMSFVFAVGEAILLVGCIKNSFDALFRLGERGTASSLIAPVSLFGRKRSAEALRFFTYAFLIGKCVFSALPDAFMLTRTTEDGTGIITVSRGYPISLVITQAVGTVLGILWVIAIIKYIKRAYKEGQFNESLDLLSSMNADVRLVAKQRIRKISFALTLLTIATIFTLDIRFDNTASINLLPQFVFGILCLFAIFKLRDFLGERQPLRLMVSGGIYTVISLVSYVIETRFLYYFGYDDLVRVDSEAHGDYLPVEIAAVAELVSLAVFFIMLGKSLCTFLLYNTGIPPENERYSIADKDYHAALKRRACFFAAFGILGGIAECVNVFSRGTATVVITGQPQVSIFPSLEWMGLVVAACSLLFIGYSLYLFGTIKEEVEMKYNEL